MPDMFPKNQSLASAPMPAEVLSVDTADNTCTVSIGGQVVDNVTWYGSTPAEGATVLLTDTGGRLVIGMTDPDLNHNHDLVYATPGYVQTYADGKVVNTSSGTSTTQAMSQNAAKAYADGKVSKSVTVVTDWDAANQSGFYESRPGAANRPSTAFDGYWYGWVIARGGWVTQYAKPFGDAGIDSGGLMCRAYTAVGWGSWYRVANYAYSWSTLDNFIWHKHGGSNYSDTAGVNRAASGVKMSGSAPSDADEWRVQTYDTAGVYRASPIRVNIGTGVVTYATQSYAQVSERGTATVDSAAAATVADVVRITLDTLTQLGLLPPDKARTGAADAIVAALGVTTSPPPEPAIEER